MSDTKGNKSQTRKDRREVLLCGKFSFCEWIYRNHCLSIQALVRKESSRPIISRLLICADKWTPRFRRRACYGARINKFPEFGSSSGMKEQESSLAERLVARLSSTERCSELEQALPSSLVKSLSIMKDTARPSMELHSVIQSTDMRAVALLSTDHPASVYSGCCLAKVPFFLRLRDGRERTMGIQNSATKTSIIRREMRGKR